MHILATLLFLAVLSLAIGVIFTSVVDYKDQIVDALLGKNIGSLGNAVLVSNKPAVARALTVSATANENFRLPLAA